MRMLETIMLRDTTTAPDANGVATKTNVDRVVYADVLSVKRSEFYAAQSAGVRADILFRVNEDEYSGEMTVVYDSVLYKVSRMYTDKGRVELTCTRR